MLHQRARKPFEHLVVSGAIARALCDRRGHRQDDRRGHGSIAAQYVVDQKARDAAVAVGHRMHIDKAERCRRRANNRRTALRALKELAQAREHCFDLLPMRSNVIDHRLIARDVSHIDRRAANAIAQRRLPEDAALQGNERFGIERIGTPAALAFHDRGKAADAILLVLFVLDEKTRAALLHRQPDGTAHDEVHAVIGFEFGQWRRKVVRFCAPHRLRAPDHRAEVAIARQIVPHAPARASVSIIPRAKRLQTGLFPKTLIRTPDARIVSIISPPKRLQTAVFQKKRLAGPRPPTTRPTPRRNP